MMAQRKSGEAERWLDAGSGSAPRDNCFSNSKLWLGKQNQPICHNFVRADIFNWKKALVFDICIYSQKQTFYFFSFKFAIFALTFEKEINIP